MIDAAYRAEYPKTVVLRDGAHVVLRALGSEDRPALAALLARAPAGERAAFVTDADVGVIAFDGERAVAAATLDRRDDARAGLGMIVDPDYAGRRLGTWLLLDVVHLATALGAASLEARVPPGDGAYRAALRRLDFVQATDGTMAKTLHATWTDF